MSSCEDPDKVKWSPRKTSREFEQFSRIDLSYPSRAAKTLGDCGRRALSALHKQWKHHTNLKNVLEDSFSPFCNQSSLFEGKLSPILMSFVFPSTEAETFFSAFDFGEIISFSLFDVSEAIFKFKIPIRFGVDNCAC